MKAEIIASGTELLLGEIADTNTSYIASQLAILGIDLYYASIVGDNYDRFTEVLKKACERSDIIIITGGLGPTRGDITREVIAGLMKESMEISPDLKKNITDFFARLGMEMPENNLKQATLIPSATAIPNPLGTAPGWWVEKDGKIIISLPGPPGEMQPMWKKEIFPRLESKGEAVIVSRTLKTWGLSEAKIDEMVRHYMSLPNPTLALYAKADGIHLRITAKAANREKAIDLIQQREIELSSILKTNLWGTDNDTLEQIVAALILRQGLSLATAESFTGGLLSCSFNGASGIERLFKGGIIVPEAGVREKLGISPGTTEETGIRTASQMAAFARSKFEADIGIGIDGFVDLNESASSGKAFIAISFKQNEHIISQTYPGRSYVLARRAVMQALFYLRQILLTG
jgi:nicotinamide-nucleotide amidase